MEKPAEKLYVYLLWEIPVKGREQLEDVYLSLDAATAGGWIRLKGRRWRVEERLVQDLMS